MSASSSATAHTAMQIVLDHWRGSVIQRQREEIERLRMANEDLRSRVVQYLAPDSDMSVGDSDELFGDDGSEAD